MCAKRRSRAKTPNNNPEKINPGASAKCVGAENENGRIALAIFSLRMERHTEMNWASVTNLASAIQGIISQFAAARGAFAREPHAARLSRARAAEKDAQRREASISVAEPLDGSPLIIRFPRETTERRDIDAVLRARRRGGCLTPQKLEADRVASAPAVRTAAEVFIHAISQSTAMLAALEAEGLNPERFIGPVEFAMPLPETIPGVDTNGRALVVYKLEKSGAIVWQYERRTRALARLTSVERRGFIEAVLSHPHASQEAVRKAREMFARAMQDARARDHAALVAGCEGDASILPAREAHNG
jgi:hypothetical protein